MRSYHERNWDGTASEAGRKSGNCGVLDVKWKKKKKSLSMRWRSSHLSNRAGKSSRWGLGIKYINVLDISDLDKRIFIILIKAKI